MNPIDIDSYKYELPESRIAAYPLAGRDLSKLLVYKKGTIEHTRFDKLPGCLPHDSVLFFNNTKVIPARILFTKETGAEIELFLLRPHAPSLVHVAMQMTAGTEWVCTIGNLKRWKDGQSLLKKNGLHELYATLSDRERGIVRFSWAPEHLTFAEILSEHGNTPLPPYIRRTPEKEDTRRYQTVYSTADGAVAAPTAGLHFTEGILREISDKKIPIDYLTLHVSAGTFQPVKVRNAVDHTMHAEQILITRKTIETLLLQQKRVVAVGTTSLRTLESIYWFGTKLLKNPESPFVIHQMDPYEVVDPPPPRDAFGAVLKLMDVLKTSVLSGETSIFILPGYTFRTSSGLITNFHQPGSTLMLLVAAFVGDDWRRIYAEALQNDYRFLSYGDCSLLWGTSVVI